MKEVKVDKSQLRIIELEHEIESLELELENLRLEGYKDQIGWKAYQSKSTKGIYAYPLIDGLPYEICFYPPRTEDIGFELDIRRCSSLDVELGLQDLKDKETYKELDFGEALTIMKEGVSTTFNSLTKTLINKKDK